MALINRHLKLPKPYLVEILLVFFGMALMYLLLVNFALGGPVSTDVIWYTNVGLNGIKDPFILNRYFDVFLQAVFLKLAASPLAGIQQYWSFLITMTCGLVYLAARSFSKRSWALHGLLAVGILLSIGSLADTAGLPLVDMAAMMMVALLVALLVVSARRDHRSVSLLIALGFVFFLAFKTKESTLPAGLVLFGLGMSSAKPFDWRLLLKRLGYVLMGILLGMIFLIALNAIILHDPLFGFRPADIQAFIRSYVSNTINARKTPGSDNWYTAYLFTGLLVPFILYLVSAAKAAREDDTYPGSRLVWLVPLAVIVFITATVNSQWGFEPRYIYTAIPLICLLAPQFLDMNLARASSNIERLRPLIILFGGLVIILLARLAIRFLLPGLVWDLGSFLEIIFIPILLSTILALSIYWKSPSLAGSMLITVLIIGIITIPMADNAKIVFIKRPNQVASQKLFYPFSALQDRIHYSPSMRMYVSLDTWNEVDMSGFVKDRTELSSLFNLYFSANSDKTNFTLSIQQVNIPSDLLSASYDYALLSHAEWKTITRTGDLVSQLKQDYQVYLDEKNMVVLLTHK